jgi:hypothetical protein
MAEAAKEGKKALAHLLAKTGGMTAAALSQRIRASNRGITRQSCNARAPVTVAARAPKIIKRNADRRVRVTPLHGKIKFNHRAASVAGDDV